MELDIRFLFDLPLGDVVGLQLPGEPIKVKYFLTKRRQHSNSFAYQMHVTEDQYIYVCTESILCNGCVYRHIIMVHDSILVCIKLLHEKLVNASMFELKVDHKGIFNFINEYLFKSTREMCNFYNMMTMQDIFIREKTARDDSGMIELLRHKFYELKF